jgi:antitoxin HicB
MKRDLRYYMSLPYTIVIDPIPPEEGGGYAATIPQLGKYAFVGDGETIGEALHDLEQVKQERFEDYLKEGLTIPEPKRDEEEYSGNFVARIPRYLHRELALKAKGNGVSLNQFVVSLLSSGLQQDKFSSLLEDVANEIKLVRAHVCELGYKIPTSIIHYDKIGVLGIKGADEPARAA